MHGAQVQVGRHPAGGVQVGAVALAVVVGQPLVQEPRPALVRRALTGFQQLRAAQVGRLGQVLAVRAGPGRRPGEGGRVGPPVLAPAPGEGGEHLEGGAVVLGDRARGDRVGRPGAHQVDVAERLLHRGVAPAAVGPGVAGHVHRHRADLAGQRGEDVLRPAVPDHQPPVGGLVQVGQAAGQEVPARVAGGIPQGRVDDEQRQDVADLGRRQQRRVVGQAEVAAEPVDRGRHALDGRRGVAGVRAGGYRPKCGRSSGATRSTSAGWVCR